MCLRFVLHLKRSNDDETTFFAVSNVNGVLTRSYKLRFKNWLNPSSAVLCFDKLTIEGVYPRFPPDIIDKHRQLLHTVRDDAENEQGNGDFNKLTAANTKWLDLGADRVNLSVVSSSVSTPP